MSDTETADLRLIELLFSVVSPDATEVEKLIAEGLLEVVDEDENDRNALMAYMIRCEDPQEKIIKLLSHLIGKKCLTKETALYYYVRFNPNVTIDIVKLFEKEARIQDFYGATPLMAYLRYNLNPQPEIVEYLFGKSSDLKDKDGLDAKAYYAHYQQNYNQYIYDLLQ